MFTPSSEAGWGWGGAMELVLIILSAIFIGVVSAIIGLARSEKWIALSLIGLILNIAPVFYVCVLKH